MSEQAYLYSNAVDASLPSSRYLTKLSIDGDKWCALHGDNLQDGVAGFGDSPELAYCDFDRVWCEKLKELK